MSSIQRLKLDFFQLEVVSYTISISRSSMHPQMVLDKGGRPGTDTWGIF